MKFVLISMIRNEERIIKRCLESLENIVDEYCIHDTGSTDKTCEIVEEFLTTHNGCLTKSEWKNFGFNRTRSFVEAHDYITNKYGKENLSQWYGILIDADMVFISGKLKEQELTEPGYTVIQCGGNLEYPNTRLVRMDYPWTCVGVTHEYWAGPTKNLTKSVCYIDDLNDGGCKHDKFERDTRLLEEGLEEDPGNVRYMFYLAQSYNAVGKLHESIQMYKRRIMGGGWFEEVWYSMYMIAQSYLSLGDEIKFEQWMLKAYKYRPERAESLYKLTKHFRSKGEHYKAYYYCLKGMNIPFSTDSLFIEKDVYLELFYYEKSILDYYIKAGNGLLSSTQYLLKAGQYQLNVLDNLHFYAVPPKDMSITPFEYKEKVFGEDFNASAVSVLEDTINVRYINYWMENGEYRTPNGIPVQTYNAMFKDNQYTPIAGDDLTLEKRQTNIKGFEDLRLYKNGNNELCFIANTQEYDGAHVSIVRGLYESPLKNCVIMKSPYENPCEKNWLPINGTDKIIYNWYPLQIGTVNEEQLEIDTIYKTPPMFSMFRGSASPFLFNNNLWTLVHFVKYDKPRKYYHCFVALDAETYRPRSVSLPFVFKSPSVEYCISARLVGQTIRCNVTFMDSDPSVVNIPINSITMIYLDN